MSVYELDDEGMVRDLWSKRPVKQSEAEAVVKTMTEFMNIRGNARNLRLPANEEEVPLARPGAN